MGIKDDRGGCAEDLVMTHRLGSMRVSHIDHQRDERRLDGGFHLLVGQDLAFHDVTGNTPFAGEKDDDRFIGCGRELLGRGEVFGPGNLVGRDVEIVPQPGERNGDGAQPEPAPKHFGRELTRR